VRCTGPSALLAAACGLTIANLYYAQPLTGLISAGLGMPHSSAGLLVTLPLAGYNTGLRMIVPLGDLFENRRLVLVLLGIELLATLALSFATWPPLYLLVAFLLGLAASTVQLLVPYLTYLVPEAARGRAVGRVVSGVMLARPTASLIANVASWREVFRISAGQAPSLNFVCFSYRSSFAVPRLPRNGRTPLLPNTSGK
jgi:MFS family permease